MLLLSHETALNASAIPLRADNIYTVNVHEMSVASDTVLSYYQDVLAVHYTPGGPGCYLCSLH